MAVEARTPLPELLAPAGDADAMRAAVANGADAVYFGLEDFNARRRAANFTRAELPRLMDHLHARNVRGYVAFNTLIFPDELDRAAAFVADIATAGADAVIVQDLGLVRLVRTMCPTLPVHASTQTTQTEPEGIALLESLGVRRVILARELSIADMAGLASRTRVELEVFVHGALCISFSGQCLASESLWGRSANRGECGQACRLPYPLLVDGRPRSPDGRAYPLSPKDLAAYDRIADLVAAGVRNFKIEGRLKDADYVAAATRVYREAIDAAMEGRPFRGSRRQRDDLTQGFSRGFTHGFLDGPRPRDLVEGRFPASRGTRVGTAVGRTARGVIVELAPDLGTHPIKPGDGVVFDAGRPDRPEQGGRVYSVASAGAPKSGDLPSRPRVEITFGRDDVRLSAIEIGSVVWKTDDPAVRRRLESTYSRDVVVRREPIRFAVEVSADRRLVLRARDSNGHEACAEIAEPVQDAIKHPLTVEGLRSQLNRLGDTPFMLGSVSLAGPEGPVESVGVLVPKSVLNDLRRRVVEALLAGRREGSRHAVVNPGALVVLRAEVIGPVEPVSDGRPRLHVLVRREDQLPAVLDGCASAECPRGAIYLDLDDMTAIGRAVDTARSAGIPVALAAPRILMPGEGGHLDQLLELRPDVVLVRNLGSLHVLHKRAPRVLLVADYSLNLANELSVGLLARMGVGRIAPGLDLNADQWLALRSAVPGVALEAVFHTHVPMFHLAHCLAAAVLSAGNSCRECGQPCRRHEIRLRDRLNVEHPVFVDMAGRTTVFNGQVQSAADVWLRFERAGVGDVRIELLDESPEQVRALLTAYTDLLAGGSAAEVVKRVERIVRARVVRGTWKWW